MSLRTTVLTSALAAAVAAASCGGGVKKKVNSFAEAGAAGEPPSAGSGNEAGGAGAPAAGGSAGANVPAPGAGAGGEAPTQAGAGGEGGVAVVVVPPPPPLLLFTVSANSVGLTGTGVAAQLHKQSAIYASTSAEPDPITGTNQVAITAAQLGIADTDTLDAFATLQQPATDPVYVFSVSAGESEGQRPTRLARSSLDHEAIGDVYFSDGTESARNLGEGSDQLGYNALVADEQSIGLSPIGNADAPLDDLTGVQLAASGVLPSEIYFVVSADSVGLADTAVAAATTAKRGCTVFSSKLDGKNTAVTSCDKLGLADGSQLKGLVLYGATAPTKALFTITSASTGLVETAVAANDNNTENTADNNIYASPLDGSNSLQANGDALGLNYYDSIDALTVVDRAPGKFGYNTSCDLTPNPTSPDGGNLATFESAHGLGDHLLVLSGKSPLVGEVSTDLVAAYDVKTCAFVARAAFTEQSVLQGRFWTPVPLPGWSAADPLKNLEYWLLGDTEGQILVERHDASGAYLGTYPLDVPLNAFSPISLDYDARFNRLFGVLAPNSGIPDAVRIAFTLPSGAPGVEPLPVLSTPIPHPCAFTPEFSGVDSAGNSLYAQSNGQGPLRVCDLTPTGELSDLPANWPLHSVEIDTGSENWALLAPGSGLYSLWVHGDNEFSVLSYPLSADPRVTE